MQDIKYLSGEYSEACRDRATAEVEWQRIAEFLLPNLSGISARHVEGSKKTRKLFDTTGIDALDKLTTLIIGTATSSVVRWFSLQHSDTDINLMSDVQYWLEDTAQRMFTAINESNYRTAGPEAIREYVAFGTGNLFCAEMEPVYARHSGFRGLFFQGVPIGTYTISEDGIGRVRQTTREFLMPAGAMFKRWPEGDYSRDTMKLIREKPWQRVSVCHDVRESGRHFKSCYYLMSNSPGLAWNRGHSLNNAEYIHEGTFEDYPFFSPRWDKATGEIWGFGRGHLALPEVATLNRARQLKLRQWNLAVNPPIMALDDGVIGQPRIVAGAINRIRIENALMPFQTGVNFNHEAIPENESKLQIRQLFYTEQILQFAPQAKTPPSATEVIQRMEFLHQLLGPSIGRLQDEFMTPMLARVFNLMLRAGAFLPMPEILQQQGGLGIVYEGPLARAQRSDELRAIGDTMAVVSNLAAIDPGAWDNYDLDLMARDASRITGASKRYLRTPEAVEQQRAQRAEAQQAQMQAAMLQQGAAAAKDMGAAQANFAKAEATV